MADPRSYGSGNPGATNVLRSGKKKSGGAHTIGAMRSKAWWPCFWRALQDTLGLSNATIAGGGEAVLVGHMSPCSALKAAKAWPRRWACFFGFIVARWH